MKILVLTNLYPPDLHGGYELGCKQVVDSLLARGHEVRVVTIAPGTINTPAYGKAGDQLEQYWGPQVPFPKRMGRSKEYGQLVASIVENDYLNGEIIRLDGDLRFPPK